MAEYHIRTCTNASCGLRYPVSGESSIGERCPHCYASTRRIDIPPKPGESKAFGTHTNVSQAAGRGVHLEVLCDNVRSLHNVGSIFRTAEGAGTTHLHLCGITATPDHPRLKKTALGAEGLLPWSYHKDACLQAEALRNEGCRLWALESVPGAESLLDARLPSTRERIVLVLGNEKLGVDPDLLRHCERVLALPMLGRKTSLNVAVAAGIAIYSLTHGNGTG